MRLFAVLAFVALASNGQGSSTNPTSTTSAPTSTTPELVPCSEHMDASSCLADNLCAWDELIEHCNSLSPEEFFRSPKVITASNGLAFGIPSGGDFVAAFQGDSGVVTQIPFKKLYEATSRNAGVIVEARTSLTAAISTLGSNLVNVNAALSSSVSTVASDVVRNAGTVTTLSTSTSTRFSTMQVSLDARSSAISALSSTQSKDVSDINTSMSSAVSRINSLSSSVDTRFTSTSTSISSVEFARSTLSASVDSRFSSTSTVITQVSSTATSNTASLATRISATESVDVRTSSTISSLSSSLSATGSTVTQQGSDIASLVASVSLLNSQIVVMQSRDNSFASTFVTQSTAISTLSTSVSRLVAIARPTSCTQLAAQTGISTNGYYNIYMILSPDKLIQVYCHFVDGRVFTSFPCTSLSAASDCKQTYRHTDANTCRDFGYEIMPYRTKNSYISLIGVYGSSATWFSVTPVYKPFDSNGASYVGCIMRRGGCNDWRVADGGDWWLRDATFSEPNGDYWGNCWLAQFNWDPNNVGFNDGNCNAWTSKYICGGPDR